jgi:hypothetical protein
MNPRLWHGRRTPCHPPDPTTPLSSGGGRVSYEPGTAYMPRRLLQRMEGSAVLLSGK